MALVCIALRGPRSSNGNSDVPTRDGFTTPGYWIAAGFAMINA